MVIFFKTSVAAKRPRTLGPYWKPLIVNGKTVDLSHLEPFEFHLIPQASTDLATIGVRFNNHCFSENFNANLHDRPLPGTHVSVHETRAFDPLRYELSKLLPAEVRALDGKRIAQTRTATLVRITLANGTEYGIFFTLKRVSASMCEMFVVSAYPLERPKNRIVATGEMKFNVAIALVLAGKKPKFPASRY